MPFLPYLSKHLNHPHPYLEIATAISDVDEKRLYKMWCWKIQKEE